MFNDSLSIEQCQQLVKKLSETAFPFQCAHGRLVHFNLLPQNVRARQAILLSSHRPSLVPLVETGMLRAGRARGVRKGIVADWTRLETMDGEP